MARVYVYVDGFNLYYRALKGTPYKWLDLGALCRQMLPGDQIIAIKYFTAHVNARPRDPNQPLRQQIYLRALRTIPNLQITLGHFLTNPVWLPLTGVRPMQSVQVDRTQEKGSDVNLASHLLMDGFSGRYDLGVLITNDSDLGEPVRMVTRKLNLGVGILNPSQKHSAELVREATFKKRIRSSDLRAAQFPNQLTDAVGTFTKPRSW